MAAVKANPIVLGVLVFLLAIAVQKRDLLPDYFPDVLPGPAVDSPFPAEGSWLLVGAESSDLTGAEVAANAKDIRTAVTNRRLVDFDRPAGESPWDAAQERAKTKGAGKPFFIYRSGSAASEGPLTGSVTDQHATLQKAVGVK
jgi:hypothetical protein